MDGQCVFKGADVGATDTVNLNYFIHNWKLSKYMIIIF
jgi:hypothetical protein